MKGYKLFNEQHSLGNNTIYDNHLSYLQPRNWVSRNWEAGIKPALNTVILIIFFTK